MMGIPPAETKRLTYWEFTAMRHEWNLAHKLPDEADDVKAPTPEFVRARQEELRALGISGTTH